MGPRRRRSPVRGMRSEDQDSRALAGGGWGESSKHQWWILGVESGFEIWNEKGEFIMREFCNGR